MDDAYKNLAVGVILQAINDAKNNIDIAIHYQFKKWKDTEHLRKEQVIALVEMGGGQTSNHRRTTSYVKTNISIVV